MNGLSINTTPTNFLLSNAFFDCCINFERTWFVLHAFIYLDINSDINLSTKGNIDTWKIFPWIFEKEDKTENGLQFSISYLLSLLYFGLTFVIRESIMLAASFTVLGGILLPSSAFYEFKDFIILFMSLGPAFGKSKFFRILNSFLYFNYIGMIFIFWHDFLNIIGVILLTREISKLVAEVLKPTVHIFQ